MKLTPDEIASLKRDLGSAQRMNFLTVAVSLPHLAALLSAAERVGELEGATK